MQLSCLSSPSSVELTKMKLSILAGLLCVGFTTNVTAQSPTPAPSPSQAAADYNLRWGVKIPMRDQVELNATLYLPKTGDGSQPKTPVIFTLTPYISDTYHARGAYFASHGYTFALVDVRGRGNSGGEFEPFANEPRDGHDAVEWLSKHHSAMAKLPCGAGRTQDSTNGRQRKNSRRIWRRSFPPPLRILASITHPTITLG
jgi:hypothetical protein